MEDCGRRDVLRGIAFVSCAGAPLAPAAVPQAARAEARLRRSGPRRVIDVHTHCAVPQAMALMGLTVPAHPQALKVSEDQVAQRLAAMDAQGVDMQVLSINPYWYKADPDLARQVVTLQNETLAETVARHPDRFVGFATVALQHPELAAEQLDHAVRRLGLRGALVGGSVDGVELSDPKMRPFWAKAEDLGVLIFIHPQGVPALAGRLAGSGGLGNVIGFPLETTIALSHLIFEGVLDRYPALKILAAHGGGFLPSYAGRSDATVRAFPETYTTPLKKAPSAYLKDLYYDSMVFTSEGLRHLAAEVGPRRIMMGTDYPYPWTDRAVAHIRETPGLTAADKASVLGDLAARVLGIAP